jgi:endonuclease/exonuclease/phosphatase family metal-dependent hydrolase
MGPDWLGSLEDKSAVIVCGDFNAAQSSKVCGALCRSFKNVQDQVGDRRFLKTLPSYYPIRALDHVFVGSGIKALKVEVPQTGLERIASDHLPLVAELAVDGIKNF